jgi:hypothetical protein
MRKCSCGLALGVGGCLCGLAITSGEAFEFKRPSAPACEVRLFRDFGPPAGCDDGTLPHNRMGWVTSVAASTGTISPGALIAPVPLVAYTARDAEDAAETTGQGLLFTVWPR